MLEICMLASGSSGNAIYIAAGETKLLIDAGLSGRRIANALTAIGADAASLSALLLFHDHGDDTCGAGVMARRFGLPLYATAPTWQAAGKALGNIAPEQCRLLPNCGTITLGALTVETMPVPHDAADPVGFIVRSAKRAAALVTDLGHVTPYILQRLQAVDCLVLEANHDEEMLLQGSYPWPLKKRILGAKGHLSNELAAESLTKVINAQTKHVVLAHLSEENNCPQLAYDTVCCRLERTGQLNQVTVQVAKRHQPSCHLRLA